MGRRSLPHSIFSGNQKIMCAHYSQIMSLLDAGKDTVAVETQDLGPPPQVWMPNLEAVFFCLEVWESWEERGGGLGGHAVD